MNIFKLPDLGEGLPDAEIVEWHVKPGDEINEGDTLVSVETAKAIIDVPSPHSGRISKLFGQVGEVIETGKPLVAFGDEAPPEAEAPGKDSGTVVGEMESTEEIIAEAQTGRHYAGSAFRAFIPPRKLQPPIKRLSAPSKRSTGLFLMRRRCEIKC